MEIDVSAIILIIAIVVANLIVLVKIFYPKEEEILKKSPEISKFGEEPKTNNPEEILTSEKNDLHFEIVNENTNQYNAKKNKKNNEISYEKDKNGITINKNLYESESLNMRPLNSKITNKDNKAVEITIEDEICKLTLKDNIIFTHNNENYSSYVLDMKHGNVKVKYRSQEKWISFSDIKKIL